MSRITILFFMGGIPALVICSSFQGFETLHVNPVIWLSLFPFLNAFVIGVIRLCAKPNECFLVSGKEGIVYA